MFLNSNHIVNNYFVRTGINNFAFPFRRFSRLNAFIQIISYSRLNSRIDKYLYLQVVIILDIILTKKYKNNRKINLGVICVGSKFDPRVESNGRIKGLTVVKYIKHIQEMQKKYEAHGVPAGIEALFSGEPNEELYANRFTPASAIDISIGVPWGEKTKIRAYEDI